MISTGQFIPAGERPPFRNRWYWKVISVAGVTGCILQLYDAPYAEPWLAPWATVNRLIKKGGIWERVGIYEFVQADDPAKEYIRLAHNFPIHAGLRIYELEQRIKELEEEEPKGA